MAQSQCRPCQPRPIEGDGGHRELPHGGARRPCRALRGLCHTPSPITAAATGIAPSARAPPPSSGSPNARPSSCPCLTSTWCSRCRPDRRHRLPEQGRDLRSLVQSGGRDQLTIAADPKHLGARIGISGTAHLGLGAHSPSASAYDRTRRRHCARRQRWVSCRPGFFLPVRVLSRLFRRLFLEMLAAAQRPAASNSSATTLHSATPKHSPPSSHRCARSRWVVYSKRPFGGPEAVLAISPATPTASPSLTAAWSHATKTAVTFKWKDYRIEGPDATR